MPRGRKQRVETTAVESDIPFPTDSGLIGDGVRVVSRLLAADRGMASAENERLGWEAGVKAVALPHVGQASPDRRARGWGGDPRRVPLPGRDRGSDPRIEAGI